MCLQTAGTMDTPAFEPTTVAHGKARYRRQRGAEQCALYMHGRGQNLLLGLFIARKFAHEVQDVIGAGKRCGPDDVGHVTVNGRKEKRPRSGGLFSSVQFITMGKPLSAKGRYLGPRSSHCPRIGISQSGTSPCHCRI